MSFPASIAATAQSLSGENSAMAPIERSSVIITPSKSSSSRSISCIAGESDAGSFGSKAETILCDTSTAGARGFTPACQRQHIDISDLLGRPAVDSDAVVCVRRVSIPGEMLQTASLIIIEACGNCSLCIFRRHFSILPQTPRIHEIVWIG